MLAAEHIWLSRLREVPPTVPAWPCSGSGASNAPIRQSMLAFLIPSSLDGGEQAQPDGYTVGLITAQLITANLRGVMQATYRDFTPVAMVDAGERP